MDAPGWDVRTEVLKIKYQRDKIGFDVLNFLFVIQCDNSQYKKSKSSMALEDLLDDSGQPFI